MLPSPSPPKKRRRIDPSPTLSKPFRSPFKTPLKSPSQLSHNTTTLSSNSIADPSTISKATPKLNPTNVSSNHKSPTHITTNRTNLSSSTPSPRLAQLQKQHTALLNQLSSLRATLDTTNQALEIEASTTDAKLGALIRKWRTVSTNAAEEVFTITKARIDDMGGVKAWKKKEREMKEGWRWEDEEQGKDRHATAGGEEANLLESKSAGAFIEEEEATDHAGEDADGDDEQEFSMETMLRSLDIPLKMIGYDAVEQRWLD
ncbi:MAG: hypothetical protein Q9225_005216 [Loekoesia sp. 1 TL-2023]